MIIIFSRLSSNRVGDTSSDTSASPSRRVRAQSWQATQKQHPPNLDGDHSDGRVCARSCEPGCKKPSSATTSTHPGAGLGISKRSSRKHGNTDFDHTNLSEAHPEQGHQRETERVASKTDRRPGRSLEDPQVAPSNLSSGSSATNSPPLTPLSGKPANVMTNSPKKTNKYRANPPTSPAVKAKLPLKRPLLMLRRLEEISHPYVILGKDEVPMKKTCMTPDSNQSHMRLNKNGTSSKASSSSDCDKCDEPETASMSCGSLGAAKEDVSADPLHKNGTSSKSSSRLDHEKCDEQDSPDTASVSCGSRRAVKEDVSADPLHLLMRCNSPDCIQKLVAECNSSADQRKVEGLLHAALHLLLAATPGSATCGEKEGTADLNFPKLTTGKKLFSSMKT